MDKDPGLALVDESARAADAVLTSRRQQLERARFVDLHQQLILSLTHVTGGGHGFCYCGAYLGSSQVVGSIFENGQILPVDACELHAGEVPLEPAIETLGSCGTSVTFAPYRAVRGAELADRQELAVLPLVIRSRLVGVVGAALADDASPTSVLEEMLDLAGHASAFADVFIRYQELSRWLEVTEHLTNFDGVCVVIDESNGELVWVGSRDERDALKDDVRTAAPALISLARRTAKHIGSEPPIPYPSLVSGAVVHVLAGKVLPSFGSERHTLVAIRPHRNEYNAERSTALSERENQVARLLSDGYTIVNAAAILGLTENTVRTHVRRLYRKLNINTRVDLVRQLRERLT